jgi:serine/threonine-protein kinase
MAGVASLRDIQLKRVCPTCNGVSPQHAKYCGFDGTVLSEQSINGHIQEFQLCQKCDRLYPQRARFCASDGSKLTSLTTGNVGPSDLSMDNIESSINNPATSVNTKQASIIGETLDGKYKIESVIAEGGMATLYRAVQIAMERTVAVKVMRPNLAMTATRMQRFEQECKVVAKLSHPNIVSVFDAGRVSEQEPYLVMEFIDGKPLSTEIAEKGPAPYNLVAHILIQILSGLEEAHAAGIVHRDLKPDNILLQKKSDRADWVKIVDFGIANYSQVSKRITEHGTFIGTPIYMAPEQFKDTTLDCRVDIYAIGILMFELLTGNVPFDSDRLEVLMLQHLMDLPPSLLSIKPNAPASFDQMLKKALAKEPGDRFQSAKEFRLALEQSLGQL